MAGTIFYSRSINSNTGFIICSLLCLRKRASALISLLTIGMMETIRDRKSVKETKIFRLKRRCPFYSVSQLLRTTRMRRAPAKNGWVNKISCRTKEALYINSITVAGVLQCNTHTHK